MMVWIGVGLLGWPWLGAATLRGLSVQGCDGCMYLQSCGHKLQSSDFICRLPWPYA